MLTACISKSGDVECPTGNTKFSVFNAHWIREGSLKVNGGHIDEGLEQ